jgi:hypothetical protein
MKVVKVNLISKNNKKNGFYLYRPIVEYNGDYYWCESIKANKAIKEFKETDLKIDRKIPTEFLNANGI